jgi:GDP-L-fucose synthase
MEDDFWSGKTVLITGGAGFLGSHLCESLEEKGCKKIIAPRSSEYDLTKEEDIKKLFEDHKDLDIIIHMAVDGGGIGYMKDHPGNIFYNNIMMATLLQDYARRNGVKKFVGVGSICSYPKFTSVPFREEDLWKGYPEETNAPYGLAKKMMLVQSQAYRDQYGFNAIHLMPVNLYGPRDDFDPNKGHVIPALIKKMLAAKKAGAPNIEVWGTGKASREFLYVKDCAEAIVLAAERYDGREPINVGSGYEITMRDLIEKIRELTGFTGEIRWDTTKPDGQPRRGLDVSRADKEFGFKAKTSFEEGLIKTIEWYISSQKE